MKGERKTQKVVCSIGRIKTRRNATRLDLESMATNEMFVIKEKRFYIIVMMYVIKISIKEINYT